MDLLRRPGLSVSTSIPFSPSLLSVPSSKRAHGLPKLRELLTYAESALFSANGTTNTTLTCNTTIWQNPNWTSGEIYSEWLVDCDPANFTVPVANIWAVA